MKNVPNVQFVSRRIKVRLHVPGSPAAVPCTTNEISHDYVFITGGPKIREGSEVRLEFNRLDGDPVSVNCVVVPHTGERLLLCYGEMAAAQRELLRSAIWPDWDGQDLLKGLILMSDRCEDQTLSEWLRLTSLLCLMQPRAGASANSADGGSARRPGDRRSRPVSRRAA